MNKNAISRFLSGAARTYTGSLQGKLESLADAEEKKRQRNQEYIDFLTTQSNLKRNAAQTKLYEAQAQPKEKAPIKWEKYEFNNGEYGFYDPENPENRKVLGRNEKDKKGTTATWSEKGGYGLSGGTPEELKLAKIPLGIPEYPPPEPPKPMTRDEALTRALQMTQMRTGAGAGYETQVDAPGVSSLADTLAGILPQPKNDQNVRQSVFGTLPATKYQPFGDRLTLPPQTAPGAIETGNQGEDPFVTKAKKMLESGAMTQEEFDQYLQENGY